jgi:hypothetical protein
MPQQSIPWIIAALALAAPAVQIAIWAWRKLKPRSGPGPLPEKWDVLPRSVFTADERRVYRQLHEALPHHIVLAKLPLIRFCQPEDSTAVQYWYRLLGGSQVTFAICSANGRVLAAMDLSYDRNGPPSRSTRIKQAVLAACRVRYLRCPIDHLPSIPELQLLVPQATSPSRGPEPSGQHGAVGTQHAVSASAGAPSHLGRRERTTLWQDSTAFADSYFGPDLGSDTGPGALHPELQPTASPRPAMVRDAHGKPPPTHH